MPLNIDIQQILLHVFNFAVLALGLYLLLYRPVKKFTESRSEYFRSLEKTAKRSAEESEQAKAMYENRMESSREEIAAERFDILKAAEEESARIINEANERSKVIAETARVNAASEHDRMLREAREDISDMIVKATEQIIAGENDNGKIFDSFLKSVGEEPDNDGDAE